jgi:cyanophycinase
MLNWLKLSLLFMSPCVLMATNAAGQTKETRYLIGNQADVRPKLHGPTLVFAGGATDVGSALQSAIDQLRGCTDCEIKVDVVVLRSSGEDGYNEPFFRLKGVDSVETLLITGRDQANSPGVRDTVGNAEVIFFAGGDQCNYVRYFKDTEVEKGVVSVYKRGGSIGGNSAGLAIMGSIVYDACSGGSAQSAKALSNPYYEDVTFTYDFFTWKYMNDTITDTHFAQRDRMGRTLAFLARQIKDKERKSVLSIAVNEKTSVMVDKKGLARVVGNGPAYFILADHKPELCEPGKPLTYSNYKIWRITSGESFNLKKRPRTGFYAVSVENGKITSNPY